MDLQLVSLFAGIGGFDLAAERVGIAPTVAVEIDPAACAVLSNNYPGTVIFNDVTEVTGCDFRAAGIDPERTVLTAGWPCQDNSVAGRRQGLGGARSGLWVHVARLLAELRPAYFVGENVPGILSVNGGRDFAQVLADLGEFGMECAWRTLDAQNFGVAQRRRRVFIVGCPSTNRHSSQEILFDLPSGGRDPAPGSTTEPFDSPNPSSSINKTWAPKRALCLTSPKGNFDKWDVSQTTYLVEPTTVGSSVRRLTPLECERIQGFPDHWTAAADGWPQADSARYRQLGNAVAVPVAQWVLSRIAQAESAL